MKPSCAIGVLVLLAGGCGAEPGDMRAPAGQLRLGAVLGEADAAGFARAEEPRDFSFPADHGPHPAFRSEWWYLTMTLEDADGAPVGVQFTLFRQALAPGDGNPTNRWQTNQVYLAHFAVTHAGLGVHRVAERFARGHPSLAGVTAEPFELWLEDWRIRADGDRWHLQASAGEHGAELVLNLNRPVVLQGESGLSRKGVNQASYYYSVPGFDAAGRVQVDGHTMQVRGTGWLDREWSTSVLSEDQIGWDWFALQLDDGRAAMLFQLRRSDGSRDPFDQGMLVQPGRPDLPLVAADFELTPQRFWRDGDGVDWPVAWRVRLRGEVWRVEAVLDAQRMDTTIRYWEGLVEVQDGSGRRLGRGYMELTGYDRATTEENER